MDENEKRELIQRIAAKSEDELTVDERVIRLEAIIAQNNNAIGKQFEQARLATMDVLLKYKTRLDELAVMLLSLADRVAALEKGKGGEPPSTVN